MTLSIFTYDKSISSLSKQDGITFFEIVVIVLLLGVLMSFAIERLIQLQIVAEKVAVEQSLVSFNSAINLEIAERVIETGMDSITEMGNTNPVSYLSETPYNYIGLKSETNARQLPVETWYYDPQLNILVYKIKNVKYFVTDLPGVPRIRFKIVSVYNESRDRKRNHVIRGVSLQSLDGYQWIYD